MRPFLLLSLAATAATAAACGDPFGLPRPSFQNVVDTVSLYALSGTPIATPSAYRMEFRQVVRTDQTTQFDFAFDIDTAGRALLLPTGAMRLGRASGTQVSSVPFDSVRLAPDRGYDLDSALVLNVGTVAILQSRPTSCAFSVAGAFFFYAKLEVVAVDTAARRLDLHILVDQNCGYRGLEPGLPVR